MLRRLLLALITALVVARPLVLGEDPGLLDRLSNPWNLLLTLLWFVAAVGWAVWRAWSGQATWRGSAVEAGLLGVALVVGSSALVVAAYQHPAFLIAAEWLVLVLVFCLVRQLAQTPGDNLGLLAALLASAVSLGAYAVYQYTVEFPALHRAYGGDLDALLDAMAAKNVVANPEALQRRLFEDNVFATYSHPNSFAGFLALLLPAAIGWTFQARRWRRADAAASPWSFWLGMGATLLLGAALWLTHSRGAILGSLLVGGVVLAGYGRRLLARHKAVLLLGLASLAGVALWLGQRPWFSAGMAKFWQSSAKRQDYWIATWHMITDHPWWGVGPGNFGRVYPRYMLARAFEKIKDPHNWLLELWATGGVFALLLLLLTLGLLFRRAWPMLRAAPSADISTLPLSKEPDPWLRWEFYLGGMGGLVLGFVLRALDQSGDEILVEGALSACRALLWFAAFAFFCRIPWSGVTLPLALVAGVAALLLNLLVSGGIAMPSVAQPLWIVAALALNSLPASAPRGTLAGWLPRMLPLPLLGGLGLAYFLLLFAPAVRGGNALARARDFYVTWHTELLPRWRYLMVQDKAYALSVFSAAAQGPLAPLPLLALKQEDPARRAQAQARYSLDAAGALQHYVLEFLEQAREADPANSQAWLESAEWYGEQWKVTPHPVLFDNALRCAEQAQRLDPDNKDPSLFKHAFYTQVARRFPQRAKEAYAQAAAAMRGAVERDPTSARLRYQLAETLFLADLPVDGRRQARSARELDEQSTQPERVLSVQQRHQVQAWLAGLPGSSVPE